MFQFFSARINTLGDRVEDTFELENFNKTIIPNNKIKKNYNFA